MVGMEGSAVLAVSKVVVVARGALAERAGAGRACVVCVDGGRAGCGHVCCGRVGCDRDLRRPPAIVLWPSKRVERLGFSFIMKTHNTFHSQPVRTRH